MFLRRLVNNIYHYNMRKTYLHLNYRHSLVPEGVPEGFPDENLGRNSQEHPVVLRNSFKDSLRDFLREFFRDFSGTSPGLLKNADRTEKPFYKNAISICLIYVILSNFKYDKFMAYVEVLFLPISRNTYGYMNIYTLNGPTQSRANSFNVINKMSSAFLWTLQDVRCQNLGLNSYNYFLMFDCGSLVSRGETMRSSFCASLVAY